MLGVLLVDKPIGCTSHDVVNDIRRRFHTKRVGHAGTLDPLATGLLVVAVGPATRFLQYLPLEPKEYWADIQFGQTTTSYDREGGLVAESAVPANLGEAISRELPKFEGLIQQVPPMFSAVKIAGKALYKYARAGDDVVREPRTVHIGAFEATQVSSDLVRARIVCSGGTYIRTLAHDLGQAVGCGAHLAGLHRTRVGRFAIEEAVPLNECGPDKLLPLEQALQPMPMLSLSPQQARYVRDGRQIGTADLIEAPLVALVEPDGGVFSVARVHGNLLQPECVIPSEAMHGAL